MLNSDTEQAADYYRRATVAEGKSKAKQEVTSNNLFLRLKIKVLLSAVKTFLLEN